MSDEKILDAAKAWRAAKGEARVFSDSAAAFRMSASEADSEAKAADARAGEAFSALLAALGFSRAETGITDRDLVTEETK